MAERTPSETGAKPGASRGFKALLVISLALNLLCFGVIAGAVARHGPPGAHDARGAPNLGAALYRALPREERRALRQALAERQGEGANRAGAAQDLLAALRADPFERETLDRLVQEQIAARLDRGKAAPEVWMARISQMSREERLSYAERLEEVLSRGPRKRAWGKRDE